jgi:thiol-disulfide isomerase/thioredoxin
VPKRPAAFSLLLLLAFLACVGCVPYTPSTEQFPADWNHRGIDWRPYALGLRDARREKKPIVLVFYTDWCPHCHNYSRVFHDPRLVEVSKRFIMIRVERDGNRELSAEYDVDGDYIPRTFFLQPNGELMKELRKGGSEYRYFLDEYEADELLAMMDRALERHRLTH